MRDSLLNHLIAVSALVVNEQGEVLLVQTHDRSDTWECPGGQVEQGEALDQAVIREVYEETGITIRVLGITGLYYNSSNFLLSVVFKAVSTSNCIRKQTEEIRDAKFVNLTEDAIGRYITRPNMKSRTLDAMKVRHYAPYETWTAPPFQLLGRLE
ncbi:NUDIX domain-containing protein [Planomicrobium sp. CPCC 101079]|uniref:NUDIX domain-containing protein n=1 Tax=Planomicrobium sp. CPCC 101079 TaxID=2599618 RepID=UPI0011B6F95D|nr:NUDIX hydrolase [Planomicrobium sp. CPCC 101079]TWT09330.1 NUDIX hydrolase [Planomicrobium sp. CPCC 101079]